MNEHFLNPTSPTQENLQTTAETIALEAIPLLVICLCNCCTATDSFDDETKISERLQALKKLHTAIIHEVLQQPIK